ncbi:MULTISPECIES: hypothetical protein [unclassified Sphingosinithalassobacter]|uniref:hypothetical protein n=1 Tax=unclassified Sphingosinithalassobacter TaxID=2676235 RepID=UPI00165D74B3|nr:hypothetical protein [Sphingosinithalassobacter sp. CS137]
MTKEHDVRELDGLDKWELKHPEQDLRGKQLMSPEGQQMGRIDDMLADLNREEVIALRMEDGKIVNVDNIDIRDGVPVLVTPAGPGGRAQIATFGRRR